MKDFNEAFEEFLEDRCINIEESNIMEMEKYKELSDKMENLHNVIEDKLPEEYRTLLRDYEDLVLCEYMVFINRILYKQGFADGTAFKGFAGLLIHNEQGGRQ